ncbi:MAG: class I SAM-dependent methyltransferase [Bacteroidota bacterium]
MTTLAGPLHAVAEKKAFLFCCPYCHGTIHSSICASCGQVFKSTNGQMDFRLDREWKYMVPVTINGEIQKPRLGYLAPNPEKEVIYQSDKDFGVNPTLAGYFPKGNGRNALSLGCGGATERKAIEQAGWRYYGVDWEPTAKGADIAYADAHALPFVNESFGLVYSRAVLEHIQHPYVFAMEAFRVLERGGTFVGSVAFLEPHHGGSFYHHSHLGIINTLQTAGFDVQIVAPQDHWNVITAQMKMGFFPWISKYLFYPVAWLLNTWSRILWGCFDVLEETVVGRLIKTGRKKSVSFGPRYKRTNRSVERLYNFAGSFTWVAKKPGSTRPS